MKLLTLPALKSDDPLGFMAALGVMEVLLAEVGVGVEELSLSWEGVGGPARLGAPFADLDDLARALYGAASRIRGRGAVLAGAPADLPPARLSKQQRAQAKQAASSRGQKLYNDPIRGFSRHQAVSLYRKHSSAHQRWLSGFIDQVSATTSDDYAAITPLLALRGQQITRQVSEGLLDLVADSVDVVRSALSQWRRTPQTAGANIDWRSVRDAALRSDGQSRPAAVPGLEWLALQSAPWFRLCGNTGRFAAWGWLPRPPRREGSSLKTLYWPVWEIQLDPIAIEVLISHPAVRTAAIDPARSPDLRRLGVLAVMASSRRREANSDGPLTMAQLVWPPAK